MRKALIVGINEYPQNKLTGCINDAKEIANLLEYHGNGIKNFDVDLEINIKKKSELKGKIKELFAGDEDVALFYFSGHGYLDETGGYLVTPDYVENDMGVDFTYILKLANESNCRNKIIILDSCYSGNMGRTGFNTENSVISEGITVLAACTQQQSAVEEKGHGLFTRLLVEALKGGAANVMGRITPGSIYAYVDQALGSWNQRPVFKTNISQFVSIRDIEPRVPLETIRSIQKLFTSQTEEYRLDPSYEFTNRQEYISETVKPYGEEEHIKIFKQLQKLERIGFIEPVGTEHMYFAAMESKSCRLTVLGQYYWQLLQEKRI
mgnify:FL=1